MLSSYNRILNYHEPLDYTELMQTVSLFADRYSFIGFSYLGESILGKGIPLLTLGWGKKEILYVGAHHGMEWLTSVILLRFINDFCEIYRNEKSIYRTSLSRFCEDYTLYVVPMLNPDGVNYQIHGIDKENPLYDRLMEMNRQSTDFSAWQANARGVDLNHNYDFKHHEYKQIEADLGMTVGAPSRYSGEEAESEPEVAHLCNFIRFRENLRLILTLHTQGEEIFYRANGSAPMESYAIARRISALTGYRLSEASGPAAYGGLTDWAISACGIPSFTLECGRGKNPLPLQSFFPIYASLREVLFTVPKMV